METKSVYFFCFSSPSPSKKLTKIFLFFYKLISQEKIHNKLKKRDFEIKEIFCFVAK